MKYLLHVDGAPDTGTWSGMSVVELKNIRITRPFAEEPPYQFLEIEFLGIKIRTGRASWELLTKTTREALRTAKTDKQKRKLANKFIYENVIPHLSPSDLKSVVQAVYRSGQRVGKRRLVKKIHNFADNISDT